jgi:hypothetical protein
MSEVLVRYESAVLAGDGRSYMARACGRQMDGDHRWEGWIEFQPSLPGETLRTGQETVQPNRETLEYWASGLSTTYLEGALRRAQEPPPVPLPEEKGRPTFSGPAPRPAPEPAPRVPRAILDPFEVAVQGEDVLRSELLALDSMHLRNIALAHGLADSSEIARELSDRALLADLIVREVRKRQAPTGP